LSAFKVGKESALSMVIIHESASGSSSKDLICWFVMVLCLGLFFLAIGFSTDSDFLQRFLTFLLAIFVGFMLVWNVTPALHTPLMSVTNAISGIIIVGTMLLLMPVDNLSWFDISSGMAMIGTFFASINIVGGFMVT
jgi:NAD(P) transhydrogenase subunit alpha